MWVKTTEFQFHTSLTKNFTTKLIDKKKKELGVCFVKLSLNNSLEEKKKEKKNVNEGKKNKNKTILNIDDLEIAWIWHNIN